MTSQSDRAFNERAIRLGITGAVVFAVLAFMLWVLKSALTPLAVAWVIAYLLEQKKLARLPGGLLIAQTAIAGARSKLEESGKERITVPEFKQLFGLTRKWAIPLLEHLDSIGATRRLGNERQILRRSAINDR